MKEIANIYRDLFENDLYLLETNFDSGFIIEVYYDYFTDIHSDLNEDLFSEILNLIYETN